MSFDRVIYCRFCLVRCAAGAGALFLSLATNVLAQDATGTAATSSPNSQPVAEMGAESNASTPNPTAGSDLRPNTDVRNEVSADPRRFRYELQITVRGVYDDNINISQTN